jgi:hypothetical protein
MKTMNRRPYAVSVIGEGITEKFYIESIRHLSPFIITPKSLDKKASSLKDLEKYIKDSIKSGFDAVFCLIDMDGKRNGKAKDDYQRLKEKYNDKIFEKKTKGIKCRVVFFETERCIELWFLYHFTKSAITKEFKSYDELESELRKFRPNYEKTSKYFKSIASLHNEMTVARQPNGSIEKAKKNAETGMTSKNMDNRETTYSEMHLFLESLGIE